MHQCTSLQGASCLFTKTIGNPPTDPGAQCKASPGVLLVISTLVLGAKYGSSFTPVIRAPSSMLFTSSSCSSRLNPMQAVQYEAQSLPQDSTVWLERPAAGAPVGVPAPHSPELKLQPVHAEHEIHSDASSQQAASLQRGDGAVGRRENQQQPHRLSQQSQQTLQQQATALSASPPLPRYPPSNRHLFLYRFDNTNALARQPADSPGSCTHRVETIPEGQPDGACDDPAHNTAPVDTPDMKVTAGMNNAGMLSTTGLLLGMSTAAVGAGAAGPRICQTMSFSMGPLTTTCTTWDDDFLNNTAPVVAPKPCSYSVGFHLRSIHAGEDEPATPQASQHTNPFLSSATTTTSNPQSYTNGFFCRASGVPSNASGIISQGAPASPAVESNLTSGAWGSNTSLQRICVQ